MSNQKSGRERRDAGSEGGGGGSADPNHPQLALPFCL